MCARRKSAKQQEEQPRRRRLHNDYCVLYVALVSFSFLPCRTVTGFIADVLESWARQHRARPQFSQSPNESVGRHGPAAAQWTLIFAFFGWCQGHWQIKGLTFNPCWTRVIPADAMSNSLLAQLLLRQSTVNSWPGTTRQHQQPERGKREDSLNYDRRSEWAMRLIAIGSSTNGQIWKER